jgi:hypothetical protein
MIIPSLLSIGLLGEDDGYGGHAVPSCWKNENVIDDREQFDGLRL